MSGSGQDPTAFKSVSRDHTLRNGRVTLNLQVPVSSSLPPVSHEGQLLYDTDSQCLYVSTRKDGALAWKALEYKQPEPQLA